MTRTGTTDSTGEAELIEWPQVDLARRLIRLEGDQTKNEEARYVPLPSRLVDMLAATEPKIGRVFDTTNLRKAWMTACAACGLGRKIEVEGKPYDPRYVGLTKHDFRRSAARNLRDAGVPETIVMKIGGWKTRGRVRSLCHRFDRQCHGGHAAARNQRRSRMVPIWCQFKV